MPAQFVTLPDHPNEIAVTKIGSCIVDGAFFLDFSRPLTRARWFGVRKFGVLYRWFGKTVGLRVPIVHEGEQRGAFLIGVYRDDPYFEDVLALWKARYPSSRPPPTTVANEMLVLAHFATQFPEQC
jgi:hypothetical protein